MSEKLYGVHVMHPMSCMVPGIEAQMPHNTSDPIIFFKSHEVAQRAAEHFAQKYSINATSSKFGPELKDTAKMKGVGVIYTVDCPDDVYDRLTKDTMQGGPVYRGSMEGMHIENITVHIMNDMLHSPPDPNQFQSIPVSLYEMGAEIAARWSDYEQLNRALNNSTNEMKMAMRLDNPMIVQSLQTMYGLTGHINSNFFTADGREDELRAIERCMYQQGIGVGYIINLNEFEHQYHETMNRLTTEGYTKAEASYYAGLELMHVLENLADIYGDSQTSQYFAQMAEDRCEEGPGEDYNFIVPDEHEEDIFC